MIDIHSHIVFDVDDGPKTREDTRTLLEESYRQGVRTIISTSHRRHLGESSVLGQNRGLALNSNEPFQLGNGTCHEGS